MFAKVAPIRRFPRSAQPYDYRIPEDLTVAVGSFVEITLRGKPERGVVVELMGSSDIKRLADIVKVYDVDPLTDADLTFYKQLATRTYQSLSSILNSAIPEFLKRATKRVDLELTPVSLSMPEAHVELLKTIIGNIKSTPHQTVVVPSDRFSLSVVVTMLRSSDDPVLVICPDINMMRELINASAQVTDSIAIFGGNMNKTQALDGWNAIRSGSHRLVVTTRIGALVPPSSNTRVVVLACGEDDHSQSDQNPHYDVRWCLQARRETHTNATIMMGTMPRIEDGEFSVDGWSDPGADVIDMDVARRSSDSYHVSEEVQEMIKTADTISRPFFVYYNRKPGEYEARTTNRDIAAELKRLFPTQSIRIVEANDAMPTSGIVIATNALLYNLSYTRPNLSGLVILNAEQLFVYRDFRSLEKAVRTIRRLTSWAKSGQVPVAIQTKNPSVIREVLGSTTELFLSELAMRRRLGYPPFADLHTLRTTEDLELAESFRAMYPGALGEGGEVVVKLPPDEVVSEWFMYPPSSDISINSY
ncbi:hypothetical protein HQ524_01570 [Candidatus Uhrbacteria bacterium]|nr:hypothetical protein [Candidatus Uhrbacteria bacterium]